MALCEGAQEGEWTSHLLKDAGIRVIKPHKLWEDNQAAIAVTKDVRSGKRTKHMEVRHFYTRDVVKSGRAAIAYCDTKEMIADIFTKPLPTDQFQYLRSRLGVVEWDKSWNEDSGSTHKAMAVSRVFQLVRPDSGSIHKVIAASGVFRLVRQVVYQITRHQ
jgi:hypothetical protein